MDMPSAQIPQVAMLANSQVSQWNYFDLADVHSPRRTRKIPARTPAPSGDGPGLEM